MAFGEDMGGQMAYEEDMGGQMAYEEDMGRANVEKSSLLNKTIHIDHKCYPPPDIK